MTEHEERENFFRNSILIVDHSNETFKELFEHHLQTEGINLYQFIDFKKHEIYHLCYNSIPCCMCRTGSKVPIYSYRNRVLNIPQLNLLLDLKSKVPCRFPASSLTACCFKVNPKVNLDDFDQTLIRCILVNLTTLIPDGSPERLAVEGLVKIRNESYGHANRGRISNHDYQIYKSQIESHILTLAQLFGKEDEFKKKFKEAEVRPLDWKLYEKYQAVSRKTIEELESIHSSIGEAIEKIKSYECSASMSAEYFTKPLKDIEVFESQEVLLECEIIKPDAIPLWLKDGTDIIKSKRYNIESNDKCHSLRIENADVTDSGKYTIRIEDRQKEARVNVKEYFTKPLKDIEVFESQEVLLECEIIEPDASPLWLKDGTDIIKSKRYNIESNDKCHTLRIENADMTDSGKYTIRIHHRQKEARVNVKAYFSTDLTRDKIIIKEKDRFFLMCEIVEDNVVENIIWVKDNNEFPLKNAQNNIEWREVSVRNEKFSVQGTTDFNPARHKIEGQKHTLEIIDASICDSGEYSVRINNHESRKVQLEVYGLCADRTTCFEGETVKLIFTGTIENEKIVWLKNSETLKETKRHVRGKECCMITIQNVYTDDSGKYSVRLGADYISREIEITVQGQHTIPIAIQNMSESEKKEYYRILEDGCEKRYCVKIFLVGKEDSGKTSLMKRLLHEEFSEKREPTDGIDIVRRCKIAVDDGEWIFQKENKSKDINERLGRAIQEKNISEYQPLLDEDKSSQQHIKDKKDIKIDKKIQRTIEIERSTSYIPISIEIKENKGTDMSGIPGIARMKESYQPNVASKKQSDQDLAKIKPSESDLQEKELENNPTSDKSVIVPKKKTADCIFLDFAGHKEYYVTHQTFLTPNAIYLITSSLRMKITGEDMPDEEKLGFWFDNIHCYASCGKRDESIDKLDPPIIVVCTKCDDSITELDSMKSNFKEQCEQIVDESNNRRGHLREDWIEFLSNKSLYDKGFDKLRENIYKIASTMPNWGEDLPVRWIKLEQKLDESIRHRKYPVVTREGVVNLAKSDSHLTQKTKEKIMGEIVLFLKYQHLIGNVIFFEDLKDFIVLKPQWLIDVFRCVVCAEFAQKKLPYMRLWNTIKDTGEVKEEEIQRLLKDVKEIPEEYHKNILCIMEKFDIIVKDNSQTNDDNKKYVIPSMIKKTESSFLKNNSSKKSSWLCLEFDFLPPALFNHVIVKFMRDSHYSKSTLSHDLCIFDLQNGLQQLVVRKSSNSLSFQYLLFDQEIDFDSNSVLENIKLTLRNIQAVITEKTNRYGIKVMYFTKVMCFESEKCLDTVKLQENPKFRCDHSGGTTIHNASSEPIFSIWIANLRYLHVQEEISTKSNKTVDELEVSRKEETKKADAGLEEFQKMGNAEDFKRLLVHGIYKSYDSCVYLCGTSCGGKSTLASDLLDVDIPDRTDGLDFYHGRNCIDLVTKRMIRLKQGAGNPVIEGLTREILEEIMKGSYKMDVAPLDIVELDGGYSLDMIHKLFIRQNGCIVVVFDGRYDLDDILPEYPEESKVTSRSIIEYWVNSALTYGSVDDDMISAVLFAATHSDAFSPNELKQRQEMFTKELTKMFSGHEKKKHIMFSTIFFVNNMNKKDQELERLKTKIVEIAMMQKTWGQPKPILWLPMELHISRMKEIKLNYVTKETLISVNRQNNELALTDEELEHYLKVHHSLGKVMYFPDHGLDNFIIIQPSFFVNILRAFVTDKVFWPQDIELQQIHEKLNKYGKIHKHDLIKLWKQEQFVKFLPEDDIIEFIIKILVHFDILIEPKHREGHVTDFFLVPCMVKFVATTTILDDPSAEEKAICLSYHLVNSTINTALGFKIIAAVLGIWPFKEENGLPLIFLKTAVLCVDDANDLRIDIYEERILVFMINKISKHYISPDIAATVQECLTWALGNALDFYYAGMLRDIEQPFVIEVGHVCRKNVCLLKLSDLLKLSEEEKQSTWTCKRNIIHEIKYPKLWVFDKNIELDECPHSCEGLTEKELSYYPTDKHLLRLAERVGIASFGKFVVSLGLAKDNWEEMEYMYKANGLMAIKFMALHQWRKKKGAKREYATLKDFLSALQVIEDNRHHLCQIFRERTGFIGVPQVVPEDKVLVELSQNIGNCAVHLGIELGLSVSKVEDIIYSHRNSLVDQVYSILKEWKENIQPNTLYNLMLALEHVAPQGVHFLEQRYK